MCQVAALAINPPFAKAAPETPLAFALSHRTEKMEANLSHNSENLAANDADMAEQNKMPRRSN